MINAQTNINTIHHKTIADEVSEGFMKNITTKQNLETNIAFLKNNKKRDEMYKKLQDDVWEFKEES
jgi:uroporphyrinogen-III synthase